MNYITVIDWFLLILFAQKKKDSATIFLFSDYVWSALNCFQRWILVEAHRVELHWKDRSLAFFTNILRDKTNFNPHQIALVSLSLSAAY